MKVEIENVDVNKIVETHIQATIAKALSNDPEKMVEGIVVAALNSKHNTYDRQTIFGKAVEEMIQKEAREVFKVWLDEHRQLIRDAIEKKLYTDKEKFVNDVAEKLTSTLSSNFNVYCSLKVDE